MSLDVLDSHSLGVKAEEGGSFVELQRIGLRRLSGGGVVLGVVVLVVDRAVGDATSQRLVGACSPRECVAGTDDGGVTLLDGIGGSRSACSAAAMAASRSLSRRSLSPLAADCVSEGFGVPGMAAVRRSHARKGYQRGGGKVQPARARLRC